MVDITAEQVISLSEAVRIIPPFEGKRVHYSTLYRWVHKGARGRKLEVFYRGGRVFTSVEALKRFFSDPASIADARPTVVNQSTTSAEAWLDAEGF
jgi:hypothetical protein